MLRTYEYKQPGDTCQNGEAQEPSSTYNLNRKQKGQSLVEFAMVVPFLLLLVVGIIELGRAYYYYNTLSKAVREGARYMSGHTYDTPLEWPNVKNMVVYGNTGGSGNPILPGLTAGMVTITPRGGGTSPTNPPEWVKVWVSFPYKSVISGIIPLNLNLTPGVEMRYVDLNASSANP